MKKNNIVLFIMCLMSSNEEKQNHQKEMTKDTNEHNKNLH